MKILSLLYLANHEKASSQTENLHEKASSQTENLHEKASSQTMTSRPMCSIQQRKNWGTIDKEMELTNEPLTMTASQGFRFATTYFLIAA